MTNQNNNNQASLPPLVTSNPSSLVPDPDVQRAMARETTVNSSRLLKATQEGIDSFDLIDIAIESLAEDVANLEADRVSLVNASQPSTQVTFKKASVTKDLATVVLQKRQWQFQEAINVRGALTQALLRYLLDHVYSTLSELPIDQEAKDLFLARFQHNLEGFEDRAEKKLRKMKKYKEVEVDEKELTTQGDMVSSTGPTSLQHILEAE